MTNPLALIIEDLPQQAAIFEKVVQQAHFDTEIILDGQQALERLATTTPALVVLDLHLPKVSGEEILTYLHQHIQFSQTQVLIVTADMLMGLRLRPQVDAVLIKPFSNHLLREFARDLRKKIG